MELRTKSLVELREIVNDLSRQRDELKAQQLPILAEIDRKIAEGVAADLVTRLSEPEREALAQRLSPTGIESGEAFSIPE